MAASLTRRTITTLLAACLVLLAAGPLAARPAAAATTGEVMKATAVKATTVNVRNIRSTQVASRPPVSLPRLRKSVAATTPPASNLQVSAPGPRPQTASAPAAFNLLGVSDVGATAGYLAEPPDTQMAAGGSQLLEMVNVAGEVFDKSSGARLVAPFKLTNFFGTPTESSTWALSDPGVLYDPVAGRWYTTILGFNPTNYDSQIFLAVSATSDATGSWSRYSVLNQAGLLCDQPRAGYTADKVIIACSNFNLSGSFTGGRIIVLSKTQLLAGTGVTSWTTAQNVNRFGMVPAVNETPGPTGYIAYNGNDVGVSGMLLVLPVTGDPAVGPPTVNAVQSVSMGTTSLPPAQAQPGGTIDGGDDRLQTAVFYNGALWAGGNTGCTPSGDTAARVCLRIVNANTSSWTATQSSTLGSVGNYFSYPALALDATGNLFVAYTFSNAGTYPQLSVLDQLRGTTTIDSNLIVKTSTGTYTGTRWGDYQAASLDPTNMNLVWVTGQYSTGPSGADPWATATTSVSVITPTPPPSSLLDVSSRSQYSLPNSDGATWTEIDPANLRISYNPMSSGQVLVSANADLWTATAGYNQDLGLFVSANGGADSLIAWKESGGFAGTFSPNAAYVEAPFTAAAGSAYTFKLKWKANKNAAGATIFAGAGPLPGTGGISPTRLTVQQMAVAPPSAVSTQQYTLASSDGTTWQEIDPMLRPTYVATSSLHLLAGGNVDLFTGTAGYNQDVAIFYQDNGGSDQLLAWKESGGFAGTFSPNAAYVLGGLDTAAGHTYTFKLKWKANQNAPGATIWAGAGPLSPGVYSPTRITVVQEPGSVNDVALTSQSTLTSSDGAGWTPIAGAQIPVTPMANTVELLSGNADLFTGSAGYNQDIGLFVSVNGGPDQLIAWKESGGFAGTYSPNAAFVHGVYTVTTGNSYVFKLEWKTNKNAPGVTIYAGAGPLPGGGGISPTRLAVVAT